MRSQGAGGFPVVLDSGVRDTVCLLWGSSAVYLRLVHVAVVFTESYV